MDGLLNRHDSAISHPITKKIGCLRSVAKLTHMGTGIREAECAVVFGNEKCHLGRVVIRNNAADPQKKVGFHESEI